MWFQRNLKLTFGRLPVENTVYANQQDYCNAIVASTAGGQSGPFIDFMFNEILKTLQKNIKEEAPNKLPDKVPNKSELSVLRMLADNPLKILIKQATHFSLFGKSSDKDNTFYIGVYILLTVFCIKRHGHIILSNKLL